MLREAAHSMVTRWCYSVTWTGTSSGMQREFPQRVDDVLGGQFSYDQRLVAFEGCCDGAPIDPLHIFCGASTTNHFHHKFCIVSCVAWKFC